jgi:hypothetical protein
MVAYTDKEEFNQAVAKLESLRRSLRSGRFVIYPYDCVYVLLTVCGKLGGCVDYTEQKYNQRLQRSKVYDNLSRREVVSQARLPPFATLCRVSDDSCFRPKRPANRKSRLNFDPSGCVEAGIPPKLMGFSGGSNSARPPEPRGRDGCRCRAIKKREMAAVNRTARSGN